MVDERVVAAFSDGTSDFFAAFDGASTDEFDAYERALMANDTATKGAAVLTPASSASGRARAASLTPPVEVDGSEMAFTYEGVPTRWTDLSSSGDLLWGGNPDRATRYFLGMMDEIHLADVGLDLLHESVNRLVVRFDA